MAALCKHQQSQKPQAPFVRLRTTWNLQTGMETIQTRTITISNVCVCVSISAWLFYPFYQLIWVLLTVSLR